MTSPSSAAAAWWKWTCSPPRTSGYLTATLNACGRPDRAEDIAALTDDLGRLPLTLSQAVAHLVDEALTCTQYRARLREASSLAEVLPGSSAPRRAAHHRARQPAAVADNHMEQRGPSTPTLLGSSHTTLATHARLLPQRNQVTLRANDRVGW